MAILTQAQVEQWIAQNGGPSALQYGVEKKQVRNPEYDPATNPLAPQYVDIEVEVWKNGKTKAMLTVRRQPDGSLEQIENVGADPNVPAAGADTRTPEQRTKDDADAKNAAELQRQRERNAALPQDQDPAYETDADRRKRAQDTIERQGRDAEAARQAQRQQEADARAEADRNKPTVTIKEDGSGGFVSIQTFPDGRQPVVKPIEGIKGTPAQIKEGGVTYERQPDGTYKPAQGIPNPNTPEPEGAPQPSFTVGDAAADLKKYQDWLNSEMRKPGATLTAARADQLIEARRKLWDTALSEQTGIVNAQQAAYRDQLTQRQQTLGDQQNRRNNATSVANQTEGDFMPLMDKLGANAGGASIGKAIAEARFNAQSFVDQSSGGGVPEIKMGPAYAAVNGMQLNPRSGAAAGWPVPTIPQPGAPAPTANAIGAGSVGAVPAPTGATPNQREGRGVPPQAAPPPAPVAPAPPISQQARDNYPQTERGGDTLAPSLTPPAPVAAPAPDVIGPSEPIGGAVLPQPESPQQQVPAPAVAAPAEAATPDYANSVSAVNRATGERKWFTRETWDQFKRNNPIYWVLWAEDAQPLQTNEQPAGHNPYAPQATPTNVVPRPEYQTPPPPQPVEPDMSDPSHVSMAPGQPAPWFLAGSSRGRAYDPSPAIASLIADPNIDNDMLRQAVALEYPGYDVDSLLGRRSA